MESPGSVFRSLCIQARELLEQQPGGLFLIAGDAPSIPPKEAHGFHEAYDFAASRSALAHPDLSVSVNLGFLAGEVYAKCIFYLIGDDDRCEKFGPFAESCGRALNGTDLLVNENDRLASEFCPYAAWVSLLMGMPNPSISGLERDFADVTRAIPIADGNLLILKDDPRSASISLLRDLSAV